MEAQRLVIEGLIDWYTRAHTQTTVVVVVVVVSIGVIRKSMKEASKSSSRLDELSKAQYRASGLFFVPTVVILDPAHRALYSILRGTLHLR